MIPQLDFIGFGPTELVLLLVIVLTLFGGSRLSGLIRGMDQGIRNFRSDVRKDEVWQFNDGRQRQFDASPETAPQWMLWLALTACGLLLILSASLEGGLSMIQTLVALGVFAIAGLTGWLCFGKKG